MANRISERVKKVNNRIPVVIKGYNAGSSDGLPTKLPAVLRTRDVTLENDIFNGMHPKVQFVKKSCLSNTERWINV